MCKIGDIIAIKNFVGDGKNNVGLHYFIVIQDEKGHIKGLSFDIVSVVMSSFKNDDHKKKKLMYKENLEIDVNDGLINSKKIKNGYIKTDQLFYFNKKQSDYYVVGQVDGDVLIRILDHISYLDNLGLLKQNIWSILES